MENVLKGCVLLLLFASHSLMAFEGDYILEERFRTVLVNAKAGDARAQYAVGDMYYRGRGVKASDKEALHWFLLAARQGVLKASYRSAYLYMHSKTISRSPQKALPWLNMAVKSGDPAAMYELAMLYSAESTDKEYDLRVLSLLSRSKLAGYKPAIAAFDKAVNNVVEISRASSGSTSK